MGIPHLQVAATEHVAVCNRMCSCLLDKYLLVSPILSPSRVLSCMSYCPLPYMPCSLPGHTINPHCLGSVLFSHSSKYFKTKLEKIYPSPCLFYVTLFPNLHKCICSTSYFSKDLYTTSLIALLPVWLEPSFLKMSTAPSRGIRADTMPHCCDLAWLDIAQEKEDEYVTYLALQD